MRILIEWFAAQHVLRRTRSLFWKGIFLGLRPQHQILDECALAESHLFMVVNYRCVRHTRTRAYQSYLMATGMQCHIENAFESMNETYLNISKFIPTPNGPCSIYFNVASVCSQANVLQRAWDNAQAEGVAGHWLRCTMGSGCGSLNPGL